MNDKQEINTLAVKMRCYRRTLKEQLDDAKAIYLMQIGDKASNTLNDRYSAYTLDDNGLHILWGNTEEASSKEHEKIGLKYSGRRQYPAFHFVQRGYGYDKAAEILNTICEYAGRRIPGFTLSGYSPSPISQQWSAKFDSKEARN